MLDPGSLVAIGKIIKVHGIMGELKIEPLTNIQGRFGYLNDVVIECPDGLKINSVVQYYKEYVNHILIKFRNIDSRNDAEKLLGAYLLVEPENVSAIDENKFYIFDIIGLDVVSFPDGEKIGYVKRVDEYPANAVIIVEKDSKEIMIPFIGDYIKGVYLDRKKIEVVIPEIMVVKPEKEQI